MDLGTDMLTNLARARPAPLAYSPAIARLTAPLYQRVARVVPEIEWPVHAPYIAAINELKRDLGAIVLGEDDVPNDDRG